MLEKINNSEDLKKLNIEEKKQLAEDIRKYILEIVSENGGHLASNLGVVELTIALHSVYNVPEDSFFVLGDNRNHSIDSRYWKDPFVSAESVIGKIVYTFKWNFW